MNAATTTKMSNVSKQLIMLTCAVIVFAMFMTIFPVMVFAGNNNGTTRISEGQIKSLAQRYLNERNRVLVSGNPDSNPNLQNVSMIEKSEMTDDISIRQDRDTNEIRRITKNVEDQGIKYWDRFETKIEVESVTEMPNRTVARISEYTRLYFTKGWGMDYSSFKTERDFTFILDSNKWAISDVELAEPGTMTPPNEPSVEPKALDVSKTTISVLSPKLSEMNNAGGGNTRGITGGGWFNQQAVIDYCRMYTDNSPDTDEWNDEWYKCFPGNDCQNFVSQALHYAGWGLITNKSGDRNWYHLYKIKWTSSWVNVMAFRHHVSLYGGSRGRFTSNYDSLRVGDVVQLDTNRDGNLNHSMIVSSDAGHYSTTLLSYHSDDQYNYPLLRLLERFPNHRHWYNLILTF